MMNVADERKFDGKKTLRDMFYQNPVKKFNLLRKNKSIAIQRNCFSSGGNMPCSTAWSIAILPR